jgi:hypothetical protein
MSPFDSETEERTKPSNKKVLTDSKDIDHMKELAKNK